MNKRRKSKQSAPDPSSGINREETPKISRRSSSMINRRTITDEDFNPDYSYVIKDLKRIGLLAGSGFIILIVLAFLLN